jgi:hypothetical protein
MWGAGGRGSPPSTSASMYHDGLTSALPEYDHSRLTSLQSHYGAERQW